MQSFNIVNTPIILLFSKKWIPGLAAEDNMIVYIFFSEGLLKTSNIDTKSIPLFGQAEHINCYREWHWVDRICLKDPFKWEI